MQLAKRLESVTEPQTIKMAKLSRELRSKGINIIDLSLGEPDFNTPEYIGNAAIDAIRQGYTKYPPVAGYPELLEAISIKLKRDNNLEYAANEIIVSTGAKQSLANAVLCLVDEGDEVLIPTPYWVTYSSLVQLAGGKPINIQCSFENGFKMTAEMLEKNITAKSKLFIFSSPCNPTGSVYTKEELAALAEVFKKYPQISIISDEIYEYINYTGKHESLAQFDDLREQIIVVNGMSKGFAMTGWRLGYMAGPAKIVRACEKLQSQFTSGANSIAQRAAIAAMLGDLTETYKMRDAFKQRRDYIIGALNKIEGVKVNCPDGAFYAYPKIDSFFGMTDGTTKIGNDEEFCMYLMHKANVATVAGRAFGSDDCIRISFANSMTALMEAIERITKAIQELRK